MSDPNEYTLTNDLDQLIEYLQHAIKAVNSMSRVTAEDCETPSERRAQSTLMTLLTISTGIVTLAMAVNEMNKRQAMIETIIYNRDAQKEGTDGAK